MASVKTPSLQDGLDQAGSAVKLLWKPNTPSVANPVVPPEYSGWRAEQRSWEEGTALFNLCHQMCDLVVEGPDALRLLSDVSANNYEKFAVGQAKQLVAVTHEGYLIQDAIMFRLGEQRFNLAGLGGAHKWVMYHAKRGNYDVQLTFDPASDHREGNPLFFRYQIQGPTAMGLLNRLFDNKLDDIKFMRFRELSVAGRPVSVLRHGMAGQIGFEFFGDWENEETFRQTVLEAGKEFGLIQVGGLAYYTTAADSGWVPIPIPGIYTDPALEDYRRYVGLYSLEGQFPLQGSFYSPDIRDYYCSPFEMGYGRSVSFNHEFIGREALLKAKDAAARTKVTLVWNADDVKRVFGADHGFLMHMTFDRVEKDSEMVGLSQYSAYIDPDNTIHSLALVKKEFAQPGTEVTVIWGQHPGPAAEPGITVAFERIRAIVQPAPFNEFARTAYRVD
ncbi:aminomethyltransferase [Bradyrhizobium sp. WSM3983]|uniref:aminomethyltransferase n=1 Tax=Bradyrhizobium sp. WSM3983 TaxID=1038867 RepID=UPI000564AE18|nr:aminomethyltransferase [Bradyrhizobium sp. WSM3983]